ncbi:MAG: c-type cytochrome [Planctomycetota bacterium]|jgi:YVTN family beta-propeller protein
MKQTQRMAIIVALAFLTCIVMAAATPATAADYLSPLDLVVNGAGKTLYIAEATAKQVVVFDIASGKVRKAISLRTEVSGLALAADDSKLYVTGAAPKGRVFVVDAKNYKVTDKISVGHTPVAPVPSPDGKILYVCNRFNNNVSVIDIASGKEAAKISVPREPVAAAITSDGKVLFVANHLPAGASDGNYTAAEVSVIDTASNKVVAGIQLPNGSTALRDITISPDHKHAYVTHILARYQLPTTQLDRGWMNTNALTIIDVPSKKLLNTVLLDDVDLGAANPWGVTCTADGKYICVTTAGTHELSVIDRAKLHDKLARVAAGGKVSDASSSAEDVPNDLSFLVMLRRRLKLTGNGPRGLVLIGTKAYVAEYFTDSLGVVDINPDIRPKAKSIALGPKKPMTVVRKGEMFFHDATLCFQKWQSCSSCHPSSARVDGFNWDLLNDGLGNPKNTRSLLLSHKTPPAMTMGTRPDAETAVRAGIRNIQFAVRPEEDAVAIDEYLKSLKSVPSPYLVRGRLSKRAKRGKTLFKTAGCASCHTPGLYTDLKKYDLGSGKWLDTGKSFDTPGLIEVWRTAPYLHDGRAETIVDVLKKHNLDNKHGNTSDLTDKQIKDLAEFILSL